MSKNKILFALTFIVFGIVFLPLFFNQSWGDAPFFYKTAFVNLLKEPSAWTNRGNILGGVNSFLWISPLMIIYGILGQFGLPNSLILMLLFYVPAIISGASGSYFFAKRFKINTPGKYLTAIFYIVNTYFLLVVDGGQVGVALAYGLFPWALYFLTEDNKLSIKSLLRNIVVIFLLTLADPRITFVAFFAASIKIFLDSFRNKDKLFAFSHLVIAGISTLLLSWYWIWPLIRLGGGVSDSLGEYKFFSILHTLTGFSPHWPGNQFGKIIPPPFYFIGIPLLISSLLYKRIKFSVWKLIVLYLLFAFLAKGTNYPGGQLYEAFLRMPFGLALRDSSKLYAPLMLTIGLLLGEVLTIYNKKLLQIGVFLYVLLIVPQAFTHKLNFNLGNRVYPAAIVQFAQKISEEEGFYRTIWIPTIHPGSFNTDNKPALDGSELIKIRPIARLSAGTYDPFNFLHTSQYSEWLDILSVKYLALTDNPRVLSPSEEEDKLWRETQSLVATSSAFGEIGNRDSVKLYETKSRKPHLYAVDKILAVVGGENIYDKFEGKIGNQGIVFIEDGKWDPRLLDGIATQSAILVFNNKTEQDLTMSFIQKHFQEPKGKGAWGYYPQSDYRLWRYQLLIRGLKVDEADYSKGISFSSNEGEKQIFNLKGKGKAPYLLGIRLLGSEDSQADIVINDKKFEWKPKAEGIFEWFTQESASKNIRIEVVNRKGVIAINTLGVMPLTEYQKALGLTSNYVHSFQVMDIENMQFESNWHEIDFKELHPYRFEFNAPEAHWIILSENYHPKWKLYKDTFYYDPIPIYSSLAGFYVRPSSGYNLVYFQGQETFRWGVYISILSLIIGVIAISLKKLR